MTSVLLSDDLQFTSSQIVSIGSWTSLVTILGLIGNLLVLYSSLKYRAVKLDCVPLLLIRSLAFSDTLHIITGSLPAAVTCFVGKYPLGGGGGGGGGGGSCCVSAQVTYLAIIAEALTVLTLTGYKLYQLVHPFFRPSTSRFKAVIASIWTVSCAPTAVSLIHKSDCIFSPVTGFCVLNTHDNWVASYTVQVSVISLLTLSLLGTTLFNIAVLLLIARRNSSTVRDYRLINRTCRETEIFNRITRQRNRRTDRLNRRTDRSNIQGIRTITVLSSLLLLSHLPYLVVTLLDLNNPGNVPLSVRLLGHLVIQLNPLCNPVLYTWTNRRFGRFVWEFLWGVLPGWCSGL